MNNINFEMDNYNDYKVPNRLLILGNGFDLNLGRKTRYSDFANSEFWPKDLKSNLFGYLNSKKDIEKWFDLEGELANYVSLVKKRYAGAYMRTIHDMAKEDEQDFKVIVEKMMDYLSFTEKETSPDENSMALCVFSLVCNDKAFQKVYSFNYTDLYKVSNFLCLEHNPKFEYVHGCLSDKSAILGVNDSVDTIDGNYDFLRKSFNLHYGSHPVSYDLQEADEVVFFGHSLGDNDYHYFQSFFRHQCKMNMERHERRDITIFTYNDSSRMEIMHTLHKMNDGQTSLLFQNNNLNIFCTQSEENNEAFQKWCRKINDEKYNF